MKKIICILLAVSMLPILVSCGAENVVENESELESVTEETVDSEDETEEEVDVSIGTTEGVDVDLTTLSSTMVYAEVFNIYSNPYDYVGKVIKMQGSFSIYEDATTGLTYFSVIIQDALACCSQGIEFELEGEYSYPEDYPELGTEVTVVGEFELYEENGNLYCRLKDAYFL